MTILIKVFAQGISPDQTYANGSYDSIKLGDLEPQALCNILTRLKDIPEPDYSSGDDLCPPALHAEGPGGEASFIVGGGTIFNEEVGGDLSPEDAVKLVLGNLDRNQKAIESGMSA